MHLDSRLLALAKGVRLRIALGAAIGLLAVGAGVGRLAVAGVVIVKVVHEGAAFSTLTIPLLIIAGLIVLRSALQYLEEVISNQTATIVKVGLRKRLYEHCLALGPGYFDQSRTGDAVLSLADGVERLEVFFGRYLPQLIVAALAPVLIFIFMAVLDLRTGLIFLAFAIIILIIPNTLRGWTQEKSMARRKAYGALGADFLDSVQGLATLKAFGQSRARGELLAERARHLFRTTMGVLAAISGISAVTLLLISTGAALALGWGAFRVSNGELEIRTLIIVLMLGVEIFRPMRELLQLSHEGLIALASADGIYELLNTPVEVNEPVGPSLVNSPNGRDGGGHEVKLKPEIRFEGVTFAYKTGRRPALKDVSFTLHDGETLGVVGPSGAGKSTAVWLVLRFFDPQEGRITLGGHDIRDLPLEVLREQIAVVTQDTYLFYGTVGENLRFAKPDATDEELDVAVEAANAREFIRDLPQGYDTIVGERAVRLSGGQKQRIAIARALLKDAPILVLDEALSSVDAENEAVIQEALDRLMEGRTTLVIAHRLSSVVGADRILVLDEGRLAEAGSHGELVAAGGVYAQLMANQQVAVEDDAAGDTSQVRHHDQGPSSNGQEASEALEASGVVQSNIDSGHEPVRQGTLMVWARLLQLARPWGRQLVLTFVLGLAHHGSIIGVGVISALLVGQVITGGSLTTLLVLLGIFVPLSAFFTWAESWMAHDLAYRLLSEMRLDMYNKLDPLSPAYLVRRRTGDLVSIVGGDIETIEYFFAHTITPAFVAVLIPVAVLLTLGFIAWPLALVLAPFLVGVGASPFIAQKRAERLGEEIRGQMGDIHSHMVDSIQGLREVTAFGRGRSRSAEIVSNGWKFAYFQLRFLKERAFQAGLIEGLTALGGLAVLTLGVWFLTQGDISRPQMILAVILSVAAFAPIVDIARTMKQLMETVAAARRVFVVHDEPIPVTDGPGVSVSSNGTQPRAPVIEFRGVGFSYGSTLPQALQEVTFTAEPGSTVALVGPSGAGKTTCANLLMRFWDPDTGRIEIGRHDLREHVLYDLRQQIALVSQDTYLFNSSIRENLLLGRADATQDEIEEAAKQANAHEFIVASAEGYDTLVGERGMQLSGGQRQRVAIAPRSAEELAGSDTG